MYILLETCQNPDILRIIYFIKILMDIVFIIVPIGLILFLLIDLSKAMISGDDKEGEKINKLIVNRIVMAIVIFFIPNVVAFVASVLGTSGYAECLNNANSDTISYYQEISDEEEKNKSLEEKLEAQVKQNAIVIAQSAENIRLQVEEGVYNNLNENSENANISSSSAVSGIGTLSKYKKHDEPNPFAPLINLNKNGKNINISDFVAMKDKNNGYSLGVWPKNASSANLSKINKTYLNNNLIYPVTGVGGIGYEHGGIDITCPIGTPIYSPVDGKISFSKWGYTSNLGSTETAYSVYIYVDKPFSVKGNWTKAGANATKKVSAVFLTHMSGLRSKLDSGNNTKVKKGDFLGFSGIANNCEHLHMTLYSDDEDMVSSSTIKEIYGIYGSNATKNAGN